MANIIEQQDLLKGLTDDRLSGLLKNPVGDIPPFLVAAEAQRRQAIRQQFAGQGQQESVVDSLTKQLAAVPQNINTSAPAQGIAGIPQQAPQQAMNNGGYVQRYQDKGLVEESYFPAFSDFFPSFKSPSLTPEDISQMSRDEYLALQEKNKYAPGVGGAKATYLHENPVVPKTELQAAQEEANAIANGPLSIFYSPESKYDAVQGVLNKQNEINQALRPATEPRDLGMYPNAKPPKVETANVQAPREPDTSNEDTSYENQTKAQDAALRKRIEDMYASEDKGILGDPEKWAAISQAFFQPDTSAMESIANALSAYGVGTARERSQERDDLRAREEALLKWDIGERDAERAAAAEKAKQLIELAKEDRSWARKLQELGMTKPGDALQYFNSRLTSLTKALADIDELVIPEEQKALRKAAIQQQIDAISNQAGTMFSKGGYGLSVSPEELNS